MRFGNWRGVALALAVAAGCAASARAEGLHTIPRLVPAVDLNTGGPYYMPPVPYGHYAGKDWAGFFSKHLGCLTCGGLFHKCCGLCGGKGCGHCGGTGCGLFGHKGCDACGGAGCGACGGHKLFHHGHGCGGGLCDGGGGLCGGLGHKGGGACGGSIGTAVAYGPVVAGSPQAPAPVIASSQCGDPGCGIGGPHSHGRGKHWGHKVHDPCGDPGCGLGHGCGHCGGRGCGLCKGHHGCGLCGGKGCAACLGAAHALLSKLLHHDRIEYFWGPGGPVPLTPGYVPYVVTTRSPRDFFAFPPFSQLDP
jgi:hypothetical protein